MSGALAIPDPSHVTNFTKYSEDSMVGEFEHFTFGEANRLFPDLSSDAEEVTRNEWQLSLSERNIFGNYTDMSMWMQIVNRGAKRTRFAMIPLVKYVQWLVPFLDNHVFDAYFRLPLEHVILQRAHCRLGYYNISSLGGFQACSWPIPLKFEAKIPELLYYCRVAHSQLESMDVYKRNLSGARKNMLNKAINLKELENSFPFPFNRSQLESILLSSPNAVRCYHKLLTLKQDHDSYISHKTHYELPPPVS